MSDGKTFAVAMIGIPEQERNVLKNIFKLSLYRAYTYTLVSVEEPSQILIVDADDSNAMAEWSALTNKSAAQSPAGATSSRTPTVMVSKDPPANGTAHYLRRPFIATRVFGVLDQVAAQAPSAAQVLGGIGARTAGTAPGAATARADQPPAGGAQAGATFVGHGVGEQAYVAQRPCRLPGRAVELAAGAGCAVGAQPRDFQRPGAARPGGRQWPRRGSGRCRSA